MITLGFNEFIRNLKRNVWIILELVLLFLISFFMVSTVSEQFRTYKPVKNVLDETGIITYGIVPSDCFNELKGIENIIQVPRYSVGSDDFVIDMAADYPDYKIKLTSGKYCTSGTHKSGIVRVMACKGSGLKSGETYEFISKNYYMKVYVTGIFDEDEWIFGFFRGGDIADYKVMYNTYNNITESVSNNNYYLFVANAEDMQEELDCWNDFALLDFCDDISEADLEFNKEVLNENKCLEGLYFKSTKEMYQNTKKLIEVKTIPIAIAFTVIFIFSLISILASSSVSYKYERRNYGIYFLTGNTWRKTIRIILVHWLTEIASALVISICVGNIIINSYLNFSIYQVFVILGIIAIQLFMALIIPWKMLRKTEPVAIVKESEK